LADEDDIPVRVPPAWGTMPGRQRRAVNAGQTVAHFRLSGV